LPLSPIESIQIARRLDGFFCESVTFLTFFNKWMEHFV
jgi:hypothetical protein